MKKKLLVIAMLMTSTTSLIGMHPELHKRSASLDLKMYLLSCGGFTGSVYALAHGKKLLSLSLYAGTMAYILYDVKRRPATSNRISRSGGIF
jgi:hypothetical protein